MFAHHAQGLAECVADRDTAAGPVGWDPGAWGGLWLGVYEGNPEPSGALGKSSERVTVLHELIEEERNHW